LNAESAETAEAITDDGKRRERRERRDLSFKENLRDPRSVGGE
jgi:hypothetical protein